MCLRLVIATIFIWGLTPACTKVPKQNRTSFDCDSNPSECNGGVDPTAAGGSLEFTVPSSVTKDTDFDITWGEVPGAVKYDLFIGKDEKCTDIVFALRDEVVLTKKLSMSTAGTFYACLDAKNASGVVVARKQGYKFVVNDGTGGFTAPSNLRISADSAAGASHSSSDDDTTIYFVWDAATDAKNGIKNYSVDYYASANCGGTRTSVDNLTGTSFAFASAAFNSTYSFKVTATNNANETKTSDCSQSTTISYATHTLAFDTAGNYTYDNTLISISGGVATLLAITQTYDDNSSSEFGLAKAHNNTTWDTDHLELKNAGAPDPRPLPNDFYYGVDATGMVLRMPFDDPIINNGETIHDDFGHAFTYAGSTNQVAGKHGRALDIEFKFSTSSHADFILSKVTLACWVRTTATNSYNIVGRSTNYSLTTSSGKARLTATAGSAPLAVDITGATTINDNKWHFVVAVIDTSNSYLYVDGKLDGTDTHSGSLDSTAGNFQIGNFSQPAWIDELAIFSRALSATEIATLYQNQVKNFTHEHWTEAPGLMDGNILLYHMDEANGNLIDYSGLGNDATLTSGTIDYEVSGQIGKAIELDDTEYFNIPNLDLANKSFTISSWIYINAFTGNDWYFQHSSDCGLNQKCLRPTLYADGSIVFDFYGQSTSSAAGVFTAGSWHLVTLTYDNGGDTSKIFFNGYEVASGNAGPFTGSGTLSSAIGVSGQSIDGKLDEFAIWNRALSPQEVQTIYNLQSGNYRGNVHELPNDQSATVDDWFPMNGNVALWHFNRTITDNVYEYDYSGNGLDLFLDNGTSVQGQIGGALSLNGATTNGDFSTDIAFDANDFTIFAWINMTGAGGNGINPVFSQRVSAYGAGNPAVDFYIDANEKLVSLIADGSNQDIATGSTTLQFNTWYQVAVVKTNSNQKLYINGLLELTDAHIVTGDVDTGATFNYIGYYQHSGGPIEGAFNGSMDEIAIWNRALSEDEIRKIYDHQSAKYSGTFTSDVMNTGTTSASWTTLAWNMIRPYGKELGTSSDLSSSYTALPNDTLMNGNVLLMHFNETAEDTVNGNTQDIEDFSGQNNHGDTSGTPTYKALGKFGYAMEFDATSSNYVTIPDLNNDISSDQQGTFSAWINLDNVATGRLFSHFADTSNNVTVATGPKLYVQASIGGVIHNLTGNTSLEPKRWYHIAAVSDGTQYKVYVNGSDDGNSSSSNNDGAWFADMNAGTYANEIGRYFVTVYADGLIDEVAIWNRALSATEIQELYRRGASRIRYQVRTCDASGCDDEPWIVPDSTLTPYSSTGEFFSELHNTTTSNPSLTFGGFGSHTVSNNQFFQWKAYLDTSDTSEIPELKSVTVGPTHYPGSNPTIITSNALSFSSLISFTETSSVGTVKYQLSNDGGTTWYWYNSGWTTTTSEYAESTTASDINTNIGTFPAGSGSLKVKAFLNSVAATQATALDTINIQYVP